MSCCQVLTEEMKKEVVTSLTKNKPSKFKKYIYKVMILEVKKHRSISGQN